MGPTSPLKEQIQSRVGVPDTPPDVPCFAPRAPPAPNPASPWGVQAAPTHLPTQVLVLGTAQLPLPHVCIFLGVPQWVPTTPSHL